MATTDLLKAVLSPEGWYCIVGLKKGGTPKQTFHETLESAEGEIARLLEQQYDTYFACSKYELNTSRTQGNAKFIKAFWLDIDCGEGKDYPDQASGLQALQQFCKSVNLPRPTVVNSGRGLHVYWCLTKTITSAEWKPVADRLKYLCEEYEFYADPARTADSASILRVPETLNFKDDPPKDVSLMGTAPEVDYETIKSRLGVLVAPPEFELPKQQLNELTKALANNEEKWFRIIMNKTLKGEGCAQLEKIATEQDTVDYNLWRAGLSVAWACEDRDVAVHKISEGHPDYSPSETVRKAMDTGGPQKCSTFEKYNPGGCDECPHKGKIAGPIQLGKKIARASDKDNVIEVPQQEPDLPPTTVVIPEYPFPYFRGKNGGIYRSNGDGEDPDLVYPHDLYIVKRMHDPQRGEVAWIRLHLPRDGVREFALPVTDLMSKEKVKERLGWYGVVGGQKQMEAISQFMIKFVTELQFKTELEVMRMQYGWTDKDRKFIIGDQEITAEGIRYSPPSSATLQLSEHMQPVGTLDEWKEVANVYDREGFEPHAFGFFTAFGSPLLKHLNLKGAVINLINNRSGTGKTTVAQLMHSVYGHPDEQMLIWRDTMNMKLNRLGIMNNLPISCDEVTKMQADDFSDFLYAVSQGRARGRMKSQVNEERINNSKWGLICVTTSNASFYDKLGTMAATPDGELMRLIEYQIPENTIITKAEADGLFPKMFLNYGHAGRPYLQWLVGNLEEAIDMVKQIQLVIDKKIKFSGRERFWSGVAACNIAGAMIAKKLGLIDIDVKRVFEWMIKEFSQMRQEIKPPTTNQASVIGEFLNEHRGSILVINDAADNRTGMPQLPVVEPKYDLLVRIEPDTKKLFISAKHLRKFCTDNRITLKDALTALASDGVYEKTVKKRMAKGTKIEGLPTDAFMFDCSKGDFINPDDYIAALRPRTDEDSRDQL
jgi:hypothetical protein